MNKLKSYLFTFLALFITTTVFFSCSNEEELIEEPYSLEKNTAKFAKEFLEVSEEIDKAVKIGNIFKDDPTLDLKLKSVKTINEFYAVLKNSNIENNTKLISLMKQKIKLYSDFIKKNKSLQNLSFEQRSKMMLDAFIAANKNTYKNKTAKSTQTKSCNNDFSIAVEQAVRDRDLDTNYAIWAAAIADASTAAAGTPIVIVVLALELLHIDSGYQNALDDAGTAFDECQWNNSGCSNKKTRIKY